MLDLTLISFVAGILTVAAPCVLPLLPVIVGGSITPADDKPSSKKAEWMRPLIVAGSLGISVIMFTLLLKATAVFLGIPQSVWQVVSGVIVGLLGINLIWPTIWEKISAKGGLSRGSNKLLGKFLNRSGSGNAVLTGFALGPVFNSCSPTYAFIVAAVLPVSFAQGLIYLMAYAIGLAGILLIVAYVGQAAAAKLGWLANPHGWFRRVIGALFVLVGVAVIAGLDRDFQAFILDSGLYDPISGLEESLRN